MRPVIQTQWQSAWQPQLIGTLLFLVESQRLLLIEKKTGHGQGKVNAPGGKWELGETLLQCAQREMREETGIDALPLGCAAELRFVERNGPQWLGYVFVAREFSGALTQTVEAKPFWCAIDAIPYQRMWADDAIWLPQVLSHGLLSGDTTASPLVFDLLFAAGELLGHRQRRSANLSLAIDTPRGDLL
ncbi:MAG: NUDIX domain-containing protein [Proteobacteria bacterium]|nr:NUDIX domain-containing protein [Pseudomonadota bacterium]